jgi:hypothetical protein
MFVVVVCSERPELPQLPQHPSWRHARHPFNDTLWPRSYEQMKNGIITRLQEKRRTVSRLQLEESQALKFDPPEPLLFMARSRKGRGKDGR